MEKDTLQELGLNEREAIIYIQLLKEKSSTASKLAKSTKINRTTVYLELNNLINKGLASYVVKNHIKYFQAASPNKLVEIQEEKKKKANLILPRLKSLHKDIQPFNFEVYEGKEGVKTLYEDIYTTAKDICAFGITGKAFDTLKFDFPHFAKKMAKKKPKVRYLANHSAKKPLSKLPGNIAKIKYLPKEHVAEVSTIIYNDKVAIQSLVKENIFVAVITDKKLSNSYKAYFEFMWNSIQ